LIEVTKVVSSLAVAGARMRAAARDAADHVAGPSLCRSAPRSSSSSSGRQRRPPPPPDPPPPDTAVATTPSSASATPSPTRPTTWPSSHGNTRPPYGSTFGRAQLRRQARPRLRRYVLTPRLRGLRLQPRTFRITTRRHERARHPSSSSIFCFIRVHACMHLRAWSSRRTCRLT